MLVQHKMLELEQDDKDIYLRVRVELGSLTWEVRAGGGRGGYPCTGAVQCRESDLKQDEDRVHT